MTNARFSLKDLMSNFRLVGSLAVLVIAGGLLLVKDTTATNAFLSSVNKITMGVGTDKWAPPAAPQLLGYQAVNADPAAELLNCEVQTDQNQVVVSWAAAAKQAKVKSYLVGVGSATPTSYDAAVTSAQVSLTEGENQVQVTAVDSRNAQSEPAVCVLTSDTIAPIVDLTLPVASVSGKTVEIEAAITETHLSTTLLEVKQGDEVVVATTGAVVAIEEEPGLSVFSYTWSAAGQTSGEYTLKLTAADQVGHSVSTEKQIALDTQAPVSTLAMTVPTASTSGLIANGGFEAGLSSWTVQGDVLTSGLGSVIANPHQGSQVAVLGRANTANQVSLVSQNLASVADQVDSVGFWYYLNPTQGASNTEGMMVFVGEEVVHQEWMANPVGGWRYLQLNMADVADPTVTVAYSHDDNASTGGELYLDGFTTNHSFNLSDIQFTVTGTDAVSSSTVYAAYTVAGSETVLSQLGQLKFTLPAMPDNQVVSFWSVDAFGNVEAKQSFAVPSLSSETVTELAPSPTPSPSPSPMPSDEPATDSASLKPVVTIADKGEYHFELAIANLKAGQEVEYVIEYTHGNDGEAIQDAIQGTATVGSEATSITVSNLYFGTCSSTAGVVCQPHTGVKDIGIIVTVTDLNAGVITEYQFAYPGVWSTESSNEAV